MKRQEALDILREHRETLRRQFSVKTLRLFGSTARNDARFDSDIDLLVDFSQTPTLFEFLRLRSYLEDLLRKKVDLVTETGLKQRARPSVERDAVHVAWKEIAGMRDFIAHVYFALDLDILWQGIREDIPTLLARVREMIKDSK